jgi:hypothetical protein
MKRSFFMIAVLFSALSMEAYGLSDKQLVSHLFKVYDSWREAMVTKNPKAWKQNTSTARIINVRNRIWSERRAFPQSVFDIPIAPPDIRKLKALRVRVNGETAKAIFFGKVDFGVGGLPTENVFVVSYVREQDRWKYHGGEYVKLDLIPAVKKQIQAGDYQYFDQDDFQPEGKVPLIPKAVTHPVLAIAKVYVFCPGREVSLKVNDFSEHLFQNDKRAEIVLGGARLGKNTIDYSIKELPGGDPKSPLTIRVYLMSQVPGTLPMKMVQYQVDDGGKPSDGGVLSFDFTAELADKLRAR